MKILTGITVVALLAAAAAFAQAPAKPVAPPTPAPKNGVRAAGTPAPAMRMPDAPAAPQSPAPTLRPPPASYQLSPGDTVKLSVFNEPDLADIGTLSSSGDVSFPLIGSVRLSGMSIKDAEKSIRDLYYNKEFLVDPRVSVTLTGYAQQSVSVSGAVAHPGAVAIPQEGRFDILTAISAAGGVAEKANLHAVMLRPATGGPSITFDIAALQADPSRARQMKPGDSLTIPFMQEKVAKFVTIMGLVNKPAPVEFPEDGLDLLTAIARAGGYARSAKPSEVTIVRTGPAGRQVFTVNAAAMAKGSSKLFELLPGDTVTVAEKIF